GWSIALASRLLRTDMRVSIDGGPQMKKLLAGFVAVLFATPLIASAADTKPGGGENGAGLQETKAVLGPRIKNPAGKDLGEIDQLLIDRNGKVTHVVIGLGGVAGVGEKKGVVPWSELK